MEASMPEFIGATAEGVIGLEMIGVGAGCAGG